MGLSRNLELLLAEEARILRVSAELGKFILSLKLSGSASTISASVMGSRLVLETESLGNDGRLID